MDFVADMGYAVMEASGELDFKNPQIVLNTTKTFVFLALFGLMIEVLQYALPVNRQFSLSDFFFNALGGAIIYAQKNLNRIFIKLNL